MLTHRTCSFLQNPTNMGSIRLTSEVVSRAHTKLTTIASVIFDSAVNCIRVPSFTLPSIDGPYGSSKPLSGNHYRVHIVHPKPKGRLEGHHWVPCHSLWRAEAVESNRLPSWAVVVVPRYLDCPSPVVVLAWGTRPLTVGLVTIVLCCTIYFLQVTKIYRENLRY